jgi:NTE family protein
MQSRLKPPLAVALQGGGAYGAFSWGVLDKLLADDGPPISAISGASAGAVNAVLLACGLAQGGREGARALLRKFWNAVGQQSLLSPMGLPGFALQLDLWSRLVSPYQFNPLDFNPLRDLLAAMVDFEVIRQQKAVHLFLSATDVATGEARVFREIEMTLSHVLASACLPHASMAVEIEGRRYWDGGLSANPPILPLVLETQCRSLFVVKLTPDAENAPVTAASDILSRLRRILLNGSLQRDLAALTEIQGLLERTLMPAPELRRVRTLPVQILAIPAHFFEGANGALHPRPDRLEQLFQAGTDALN